MQNPVSNLLKALHHDDQNDNHENEACPGSVIEPKCSILSHIIAHSVFSPLHLRINQPHEGAGERVDEAGNNGRTGRRENYIKITF